jgi:acyl phosphate:glycerol-3-phosphate acyltransferase
VTTWLLLLGAYLIGATPTSYLVGRLARGIDLRQHGSGNLGATNAYRVLGWRYATPIFLIDIAKGWVPTFYFWQLAGQPPGWALAFGAATILGHVFSVYVRFKGGKGVATGAGVFLALAPLAVLIGLAVWLALVITTGYVSLASIVAAALLPALVYVFRGPDAVFWLALALGAFVIWAHRSNVGRLRRGEEHRFGRRAKAAS